MHCKPMQQSLRSQSGMGNPETAGDAWLFETPPDLLCPITHNLFKDPVINAAGQVYERVAIEYHLSHKGTDPITNAPLTSTQLIPVYTLKSRTYEFREHVAKACVERACSTRSCDTAVKYLRRAAELVVGLGSSLKVPGLCIEVVDFLQTHTSNAYNSMALRIFADGLRQAGYVDQAMQLYLRLVEWCGDDPVQQAAALRQCLICFGHDDSDQPDRALLPFLAQFLEAQQTFTAGQVLDLLQEAHVPETLIVQLFEHLLTRRARSGSAVNGDGLSNGNHMGIQYPDLLLQYAQLRFRGVQRQLDGLQQTQTDHIKAKAQPDQQSKAARMAQGKMRGDVGATDIVAPSPAGPGQEPGPVGAGDVQHKSMAPWQKVARFLNRRRKTLASASTLVLALLDGRKVAVRLLQAGSVIALVHACQGKGGGGRS